MPTHMTSRLENALVFAAQLHREQWRKGSNVPYVSHLLAVSALVIEHGGDEDEAIATLLHDAIEDQGGPKTRDEILRRFGEAQRFGLRGGSAPLSLHIPSHPSSSGPLACFKKR